MQSAIQVEYNASVYFHRYNSKGSRLERVKMGSKEAALIRDSIQASYNVEQFLGEIYDGSTELC